MRVPLQEWRYEVDGASVTFVEIWVLERARLWNILEQFPDTASRIRHNAIRRIFRLEILACVPFLRFLSFRTALHGAGRSDGAVVPWAWSPVASVQLHSCIYEPTD